MSSQGIPTNPNSVATSNKRKTVDGTETPTNDALSTVLVSALGLGMGLWFAAGTTSTAAANATAGSDWNASSSGFREFGLGVELYPAQQCDRGVLVAPEESQTECLAFRVGYVSPRTVSLPSGFGSGSNSSDHPMGFLETSEPWFWELPPHATDEWDEEVLEVPEADESDEAWRRKIDEQLKLDCDPKEDWMLPRNAPSTCNPLHELFSLETTPSMRLLNCGTSHCALSMDDLHWDSSPMQHRVVFKLTMLDSDFDYDYDYDYYEPASVGDARERMKYEQSWKETIALERLQRSPYVLDIYGNCQQSQVAELAHDASMTSTISHNRTLGTDTAEFPPASSLKSYSLLDWINVQREYDDTYAPLIDSKTKLLVAYQIASAVADVHYGSCSNNPDGQHDIPTNPNGNTNTNATTTDLPSSSSSYCMAHNDLFIHQFLFVNGRFKINDFNLANFARVRKDDPSLLCLDPISELESAADKTKSPEELLKYWSEYGDEKEGGDSDEEENEDKDKLGNQNEYRHGHEYEFDGGDDSQTTDINPLLERNKVDVWYLGQAIYHVLTLHWMWEDIPGVTDELRKWIMEGDTSPIPKRYLHRYGEDYPDDEDDYADDDDDDYLDDNQGNEDGNYDDNSKQYEQLLVETIKKCWTFDPSNRPTSLEIRDHLKTNLERLGFLSSETPDNEDDESWAKVRLPPIPPDYTHSEDDYNWSLYGAEGLTSGWFNPRSPELLELRDQMLLEASMPPDTFPDSYNHDHDHDHHGHMYEW
eukprot:jgi/Psemu1/37436/gm1.37436_g